MQGNSINIKISTKPLDFLVEMYYFCTPFTGMDLHFFAKTYTIQTFAYKSEVNLNNGKYTLFL